MEQHEEEIHLLDYWRVIQKRRNIAVTFFAVVVGIVAVYSFLTTPIYQGTAQILVKQEENPTMTFVEGGTALIHTKSYEEYSRTQIEILSSRAFADRVVRKLQLDRNPYFLNIKEKKKNNLLPLMLGGIKNAVAKLFSGKTETNPFPDIAVQQEADPDLTDIILENMTVVIGKQSNIFKINYQSENPSVAGTIANGIASAYIEHNLDMRVRPYRDAVEWLSARLVELRSKVEESNRVLQQYKEGKGIVSFETKENVITQKLQELVSQLVQAEGKRQETEIRYNQIKSVIDSPELLTTVPDIMNNLVIQGLRNEELKLTKNISELSEKYGPKHPQLVKASAEHEMVRRSIIAEAKKMLNAAKTEYEIAKNRETSLRISLEEQKQDVLDLSKKAIEFNVLAGEAESNKQFYELLLKKMQEASLSGGLSVSNIQIVDNAVVPKSPTKPRRGLNIFLAMVVGLFGGIFAVFFVEYMDDTIKTPEDADKILGLPFLSYVPSTKKEGPIFMLSDPKATVTESYRTIRTGVILSSVSENPLKVILVTSATPNEGKTTTAANLAAAMAQMGEKVLLIDADMRRHNLHEIFNLDNSVGISDVIVDNGKLSSAIRTIPDIPDLNVITGGTLAPNPLELLSSNRMKDLFSQLRERYDRIILDSPPIMAFSDSLILSKLSDSVILIIWGGMTSKDTVKKAVQSLTSAETKILGVVLNNVDITKKSYYSYYSYPYYNYYYGSRKDKKKKQA